MSKSVIAFSIQNASKTTPTKKLKMYYAYGAGHKKYCTFVKIHSPLPLIGLYRLEIKNTTYTTSFYRQDSSLTGLLMPAFGDELQTPP